MKLLRVFSSPRKQKKLRAEFLQDDGSITHTDFGATGYMDFTMITNKELAEETRSRYWSRHRKEYGQDPDTPGMLSLFLLWGRSQNLRRNISEYKKLYNL
jgi:hypothetical protein